MRLGSEEFREVMGHFVSGVTVVTAAEGDTRHATTVSALTSVSLEPPMLLVCMNRTSQTGQVIRRTGSFAVNVLGAGQATLAQRFAGKGTGKLEGVDTAGAEPGAPLLAGALAHLRCRVVEVAVGGTHWVFISEVDEAVAGVGVPLGYFRGGFGTWVEPSSAPTGGEAPAGAPPVPPQRRRSQPDTRSTRSA